MSMVERNTKVQGNSCQARNRKHANPPSRPTSVSISPLAVEEAVARDGKWAAMCGVRCFCGDPDLCTECCPVESTEVLGHAKEEGEYLLIVDLRGSAMRVMAGPFGSLSHVGISLSGRVGTPVTGMLGFANSFSFRHALIRSRDKF